MSKVFTFRVSIEGLENKIWRIIEIIDLRTLADLAYSILASFDSLAYHMYSISYKESKYSCVNYGFEPFINDVCSLASSVRLNKLNLSKNDVMVMEYDTGSPTDFVIEYLGNHELETGAGRRYPYIKSGMGSGMIDDISGHHLFEIIEDIDRKGISDYFYTMGYERECIYDYRVYDINLDNATLKEKIEKIKEGYESISN